MMLEWWAWVLVYMGVLVYGLAGVFTVGFFGRLLNWSMFCIPLAIFWPISWSIFLVVLLPFLLKLSVDRIQSLFDHSIEAGEKAGEWFGEWFKLKRKGLRVKGA